MGSWFSNIQIQYPRSLDMIDAERIADLFTVKHDLEKGEIEAGNVMYVVTTVIAFYLGTQHEAKATANAAEEKTTA